MSDRTADVFDALRAVTVDDEERFIFRDTLWLVVNAYLTGAGKPTVPFGAFLAVVTHAGFRMDERRLYGLTNPWWSKARQTNNARQRTN
ncbi:hypothetical protein [Streptomyces sp. NBC_01750]|uniref:hypothetical protein n=1 Tax=Streptomyces sp. NBC_01750 TaxID=2975928 RepID=UPI002DDA6EDB|nr:hypothetical protein [Streptomyces sp. NBC_01750]WSD32202.1 hypothetical protein OG966_09970 [Streptomyces sp. NBC_01750]